MNTSNQQRRRSHYRIELEGRLDEEWTDCFDGLTMSYVDGKTTLVAPAADQAALHGLLNWIRDMNLTLISVRRLDDRELDPRDLDPKDPKEEYRP